MTGAVTFSSARLPEPFSFHAVSEHPGCDYSRYCVWIPQPNPLTGGYHLAHQVRQREVPGPCPEGGLAVAERQRELVYMRPGTEEIPLAPDGPAAFQAQRLYRIVHRPGQVGRGAIQLAGRALHRRDGMTVRNQFHGPKLCQLWQPWLA